MKTDIALHLLPSDELQGRPVSPHSTWYDLRWVFDNPTAGQPADASAIRWDLALPDGSSLTHPRWASLLDACRRLVWSLLVDPRHGKQYKPAMMSDLQRQIAYFVRWMVGAGYASFGELDAEAFDEYVDHLVADKKSGDDDDDGLSATYLLKYLRLPVLLMHQGEALREAGVEVPREPPYRGKPAWQKAKELARDIRGSIPPVPDHVFLPSTVAAINWVDTRAEAIIGLRDAYLRAGGPAARTPSAHRRILSELRSYVASVPDGEGKLGTPEIDMVRRLVDATRDACAIVLQALVGIRVSELCGLEALPLDPKTGLPGCVTVRPSGSGLHELFFVRGRLFKTEQTWSEQEWIAGSRPVGTDLLPPPIRALSALERLLRPWRGAGKMNRMLLGFSSGTGLTQARPMKTASVSRGQQRFFSERVGIGEWHITTHQWRKSFAQYVIRTDSRMLPSLREHFKHLSVAMTEQGYIAADPELKQIVDDAAVQATVRLVADMISGRKRAEGPLVAMLRESAARLDARLANRSDEEKLEDIEEMVRSSGMRAWDVHWGDASLGSCMFRPGTGSCTDGCPTRWVMRAPLWSAARPDLCWECRNLVVTEDHREFWLERLRKNEAAVKAAVEADDAGLAMLCRERVAQCRMVLCKMEDDMLEEIADVA